MRKKKKLDFFFFFYLLFSYLSSVHVYTVEREKHQQAPKNQKRATWSFCRATMNSKSNQSSDRDENHSKKENPISTLDSRFNQTLRNVQGYQSSSLRIYDFCSFLISYWYLLVIFLRFENPFGKSFYLSNQLLNCH